MGHGATTCDPPADTSGGLSQVFRADTIRYHELLEAGSWAAARKVGRMRIHGKDFVAVNGGVMEFRFKVQSWLVTGKPQGSTTSRVRSASGDASGNLSQNGSGTALWAVLVVAVAWNVISNLVLPGALYVPANLTGRWRSSCSPELEVSAGAGWD